MGRIIVPRIVVRPLLPPEGPKIGVRVQPQYLHWQVGRYKERLTSGPGGLGRGKIWVPEREGEQHNLILDRFYDVLIPQYGFVVSSLYAAVGTGSAAPDPTQTGLQSEVARTNFVPSDEISIIEPLPDYGVYDVKRVCEFTEAQVGGRNLTEWGFGPTGSASSGTMNRELFRDGNGNPVVLTLDTGQRLRLIYRYRITLTPTTPQAITVNIGGEGPGPRTAKFVLTGRRNSSVNNLNVYGDSNNQRGGSILVANYLASGIGSMVVRAFSSQAPLTYINSVSFYGRGTAPDLESRVGRTRRASVLFSTNEANITIVSVVMGQGSSTSNVELIPSANLVFDPGQEFTKDGLHKLFVGYWQITWGS